jgi:methionine sulfoxide reductase heme-binding subunit
LKPGKPTFFQVFVHTAGILPLVWLIYLSVSNQLGTNPILQLEQSTGKTATYFLILSLACTPVTFISGWQEPIRRRKALGLYGALFGFLHFLIFIGSDYGFDAGLIVNDILHRPFILIGTIALIMLIPLTITSSRYWLQKLGPNWKRLHRLVYIISPLVIIHYVMAVKGNLFRLQANYVQPLLLAAIVIILLVMRIPKVRILLSQKSTPGSVIKKD